jgi:hypothetical protein
MTKAARKAKNEAIAARMKADKIERTTGRCCICYVVYHADFVLGRGFASHRCQSLLSVGGRRAAGQSR